MDILGLLRIFNYGLICIYGLFLSVYIAGGWTTGRQKRLVILLGPILLLVQGICFFCWGLRFTMQIYPLIVHLPLVLLLVFVLKRPLDIALVSVVTAYLCCQLPRWARLIFMALTKSVLAGEISYTAAIALIYFLLYRYFVQSANDAITYSTQTLVLFGSLPCVYYVFEYAVLISGIELYMSNPALAEFSSTFISGFYVMFLAAYHAQIKKTMQSELQKSVLEVELKQSGVELESVRNMEVQTAIYRHDMRHHLTTIDALLSEEKVRQAREYIKDVRGGIESLTLRKFCNNNLANLLCSYFVNKAEREGVRLTVDVTLPEALPMPDMELCSLLSNGLENALHAVSGLEEALRWARLYCTVRTNKILLEIKNPYQGEITMRDGLPVSNREGHGYGCRCIQAIVRKYEGIYCFNPEGGVFTLQIVLPVS